MIIKLHSIDPERVGIGEQSKWGTFGSSWEEELDCILWVNWGIVGMNLEGQVGNIGRDRVEEENVVRDS